MLCNHDKITVSPEYSWKGWFSRFYTCIIKLLWGKIKCMILTSIKCVHNLTESILEIAFKPLGYAQLWNYTNLFIYKCILLLIMSFHIICQIDDHFVKITLLKYSQNFEARKLNNPDIRYLHVSTAVSIICLYWWVIARRSPILVNYLL